METIPNMNDITGQTEQDGFSIRNNYKFDAMMRAIDFFSQRFNLEMLIDFAGDFINEILTLGASAVFLYDKKDDCFHVTKSRIYKTDLTKVPNTGKLQDIATLFGTIVTRNFTLFFGDEFLEDYKPVLLIPLIHSNRLIGFIVTVGKAIGDFTEDDYSMAKAIMNLFNDAFERNQFLEELSQKEKKLDNKIFELYTVNKASKVLFSEINLNKLLGVGVEIFSEVSGSMVTAFGVKNSTENALVAKAYSDVRNNKACPSEFYIYLNESSEFQKDKYIFNTTTEMHLLKNIFKNPEKFDELDAEYVVLIVKDTILGFVTLGKYKVGERYTQEVLELINSLAISCFIALNNAILFDEIVSQKKEIEKQYNSLLKLAKTEGF